MECKPWKIQLPTRTLELEFTTISSAYHVEMNPSDVGNNDRHGPPARLLPRLRAFGMQAGPRRHCPVAARCAVASRPPAQPCARACACALPCPRRYVVQEIIKEMAKSRPIGADGQQGFKVSSAQRKGIQPPSACWAALAA